MFGGWCAGKIASIASGKPLSPSTQQIRMSCTPRVFRSLRTCIQNFAPSVSWNHIPSTSRSPVEGDAERQVQRAALHRAHQVEADLDAVDLLQVRVDVAHRQFAAVEREDLLVDPTNRRWRLRMIFGSKLPSRSRGASIWTVPCSQVSVFGEVPLRWFPAPLGGS